MLILYLQVNIIQYINLGVAIFAMLCLGAFIYYKLYPAMQQQNDEMKKFLMTELTESKKARTQELHKFSEIANTHAKELRGIADILKKMNEDR